MTDSILNSGVYLITHLPSGLKYVGASLRPQQRIQRHLSPMSNEHWKQHLPKGDDTPASELSWMILESVEDTERDQAERDWWFLLKPELNGPRIPTMRGLKGGRLIKNSTCQQMRDFIQECAANDLSSDKISSLWDSKDHLWTAVVDLMAKGAQLRRGHLLQALNGGQA